MKETIFGSIVYSFPLPYDLGFIGTKRLLTLVRNAGAEQLYQLGPFLACESPESHTGSSRWAIDFLVPDGTPVLAAADGTVVALKLDSKEWGSHSDFADKANYIVIDHGGEFSQYCHLAPAKVQIFPKGLDMYVGKVVRREECIGHVRKTGWTTIDHLHFMVFRRKESPDGFESVEVDFLKP
jgi:murein DD-endopeptidase MepM/ murein hydrolase activator NlpD